jgi:hypothetical protein
MTSQPTVHPLAAVNLVVGTPAPAKRRERRRPLESTLRAARKAGARRVELTEEKIVIDLSDPAQPRGADALETNEWDEVMPGGRHGSD